MRGKFALAKQSVIVVVVLLSLVFLPSIALALPYYVGVYDAGGTPQKVRATYAMNYVMTTRPGIDHVNSIYVRYDTMNQMECGWYWQGQYSGPSWLVRWDDNGAYDENSSYEGTVPGWPTPGTNYGFKIENGGFNSTTFVSYVNGYEKGRHTYRYLALGGDSIIGSERADQEVDSNYAHFWSCQKIKNASGQGYVSWQTPMLYADTDNYNPYNGANGYKWQQSTVTNHYVVAE